ncbi:MAG: SRPBCC family protein [Actinomycetota bacterium]
MTDISATIEIDRPAGEVFDYLADMANNPQWQQGQQECRWTSEPPLGLGSTYDQEARFLGRSIVSSFEVVEFEPGRRIRIVSTAGTMPIDVTRTVEPIGPDRCRVSARVAGDPPLLLRLLGPLLDRLVERSVTGDYRRLKERLEQGS